MRCRGDKTRTKLVHPISHDCVTLITEEETQHYTWYVIIMSLKKMNGWIFVWTRIKISLAMKVKDEIGMINSRYTLHAIRCSLFRLKYFRGESWHLRLISIGSSADKKKQKTARRVREVTAATSYLSLLLKVSLVFSVQCHSTTMNEEDRWLGSPFS